MRRIISFVCLMAVLAMSLGSPAGTGISLMHESDAKHLALHLESTSHHHNDDGSVHLDDSQESQLHMQADTLYNNAGVPSRLLQALVIEPVGHLPPGTAEQSRPQPYLEGLKRPPRPAV